MARVSAEMKTHIRVFADFRFNSRCSFVRLSAKGERTLYTQTMSKYRMHARLYVRATKEDALIQSGA